MIPNEIKAVDILDELNRLGWLDYKIEMACGFSRGYVGQVRNGNVQTPGYGHAAKLLNLLERERARLIEQLARCPGAS